MIGDAQRMDNGRAIDDGNHHDKEQHEADNAPRFYGHQAEEYQRQADIAHAHEPHPCKSLRVTGATRAKMPTKRTPTASRPLSQNRTELVLKAGSRSTIMSHTFLRQI